MGCFLPKDLYGIIGWPLGQTLSPLLHNTSFQSLGIPAVYLAWPLPEADLDAFVEGMRIMRIQGCSVTIPYKIAVLKYLDSVSEPASLAGAVNTLFWRNESLCGENTDVAGFLAPLGSLPLAALDVLLLGAGGAAHAVAAALRLSGCSRVRVASPGNQRQYQLAERFAFTPLIWEDRYLRPATLVINATPMGMTGRLANENPYDFAASPCPDTGWAYDLVYNPLNTPFLESAAKNGRTCISGLEMFLGQGNAQFRLWTGHDLSATACSALKKALGAE